MPFEIDRRLLLQTGLFGLGALSAPATARLLSRGGFTHNVASGEPSQSTILLWTRYVSEGEPMLRAEVAEDAEFGRIVGRAEAPAVSTHDFTAKATVTGLDSGKWYYYRFLAPDGTASPTGRTRTLPEGSVDQFRLGVMSCSNMRFGFFNAYAHAAARDDLDLIVHTGDYLYEYARGIYPSEEQALASRQIEPATEILALADYWLRYQSYRADPDLQALHRNFPMIARWDDHEIANDPWVGGAQNHQPDEGDWAMRKAAALQAYHDWMPVSDAPWDSYQVGDLATILLPETRITGRSEQLDYRVATLAGDLQSGLRAFRDGPWSAAERSMLGAEQEAWLANALAASTASGTRWQVLSQQTVMGTINYPQVFYDTIPENAPEQVRQRSGLLAAAARQGLPLNLDAWDGYPAARERLLRGALDADANLIALSGDSHNGWAHDLSLEGTPVGVEMAGHSVTSPGFESFLPGVDPARVAGALVGASETMRWANTADRGYMTVTLTPEAVRSEWVFLDTIRQRSVTTKGRHAMTVQHGSRVFSA